MKAENMENSAKTRFLVWVLFSFMVAVALIVGLWPFEFTPDNGARLKGAGLEFTSRGIANAWAGKPLFSSGEVTVALAALPVEKPMDRTVFLLSFYDSSKRQVLSVSQWNDRIIIRSGAGIKTGVKALEINRKTLITVSAGKQGVRLYIDGKASAVSPLPFNGIEKVAGFTLGNSPEGKHAWKGSVHYLAIWTRVLSDDEVLTGFEALAQTRPDLPGLAGFYLFDERGQLISNAVSGELDISVPERFSPVKRIFLGPLFEGGGRLRLDHVDAAVNFTGFIPLGLLAFFLRPAAGRCRVNLLFAVAAGFLLSLAIESVQVFMPDRFSQFSDLLLNTSGALAGALAAVFFKNTLRRLID